MLDQEIFQEFNVLGLLQRLEVDHIEITAPAKIAAVVDHEGRAAAHSGGEVAAGRPNHDHRAAGHILASVVAGPFNDRQSAAVADAESFAGAAAEECPAAGGAIESNVADQDVILGDEPGRSRRIDDDLAAG